MSDKKAEDSIGFKSKSNSPIEIDKSLLQDIIGTVSPPECLTDSVVNENDADQDGNEKTNEHSEQTNSKTSRELKLLLALSKEANLDTNISYKRKTLEGNKSKEKEPFPKTVSADIETKKVTKVAHENKNCRYPVTAESELELELPQDEVKNVVDNASKTSKRKRDSLNEVNIGGATEEIAKRNRKSLLNETPMSQTVKDAFCWRCHREGINISCETCPRSYHQKCLKQTIGDTEHWPCPECVSILKAESTQTRSEAMKGMTLEHLCSLLKFAVNRMIQCQGSEPFLHPVSDNEFPEYKRYIIQPMDLTKIKKNIKENLYGSTQAFEADAKWLLHNSIIFNSYQSKLTSAAKSIVKICKQEMAEIENCPSCYLNANTKKGTWFVEVCPKPHLLVWAKLKGFPYWPAKAMCTNSAGMVDVRFFGAHDRAWVHYKECYLFSEKDPNTFKQKRYDIEKCIEELNIYIENLRKTYGEFKYAPFKTTIDPNNEIKQLQIFLPKYKTQLHSKKKINNKNEVVNKLDSGQESKEVKPQDISENAEKEISDINENKPHKGDENKNLLQTADKIEMKENIPGTKKNEPALKQNDAEIKANGITSPIYSPSKYHDNDITMEGYGTDDDTNIEIDMERRKTFIDKQADNISMKTDEIEGEEEDEEDSDTQVPSNISVDSMPLKSNIRAQGSLTNSTGKTEVLPRRISDVDNIQKRQSMDDVTNAPVKVSRRSSDQSVNSDSSRISNISDKINRVDISENMEVTLGNDDIGRISISENISSNSNDTLKSDTDHGVEGKRKPVQVEIENVEFTISPANKLKIADKLMKRLSDVEESAGNTTKVEEGRRSDIGKKSPTDILIEKFKGVVEREIVDFSQPSTSSKEQVEDASVNKSAEISTTVGLTDKASDFKSTNPIPIPVTSKTVSSSSEISVNLASAEENNQPVNNLDSDKTVEKENTVRELSGKNNSSVEKKILPVDNLAQHDKDSKHNKEPIQSDKKVEKLEGINKNETNKKISEKHKALQIEAPEDVQKKQKKIIQSSITSFAVSSPAKHEELIKEKSEEMTNKPPVKAISCSLNSASKSDNEKSQKAVNTDVMNIIEEFDDNEEMEILDDIEIDKNNIFNIIHSSLNESKLKDKDDSVDTNAVTNNTASLSKKRKLSSDDTLNIQSKLVKVVPIENILKKHIDREKESTTNSLLQKSLQGKKMIRKPSSTSSTPSSVSRRSSLQEIITEEIKSEPETDDDFSESENLEAKRKYLSALNILEKINDADKKLKAGEIRTRSKTEEKREKFKVVDNLTRIIDDVALNYSAVHEGQELPTKKPERRKSVVSQEGEIFVKSFAKIPPPKHRARKSFPMPTYLKPNNHGHVSVLRKDSSPTTALTKKEVPKTIANIITTKVISSTSCTVTTNNQKAPETGSNMVSHVILLPPNQTITYNNTLVNPVLSMVTPAASTSTATSSAQPITHTLIKPKITPLNVRASQNYIPQNEEHSTESPSDNAAILSDLLNQPIIGSREPEQAENIEICTTTTTSTSTTTTTVTTPTLSATTETAPEDEFSVLNSILPENVSRAMSDLLVRPPPKLKPRPPGMLSTIFDEGVPSSAGTVTAKINSVAHRLGDYFRGMLIETLEDLGKAPNPEAKITSLQMEIESLKFRHNVEISEIRKNICTILKDIQRSIVEDRDRIIEETRAVCEAETIKRVEVAKSKQWCANCAKEAQFYCCWNTSYCDYPCQQKHWPQHLGKCTQNIEKSNNTATPPNRPSAQQLILRPTIPPKPGMGRIVAKPTKVYMNRNVGPPKTFKTLTTGNLTVIETTPGNYELVGNGPIAVTGKFLATTSNIFHSKLKTTNVMTVASPSTSGVSDQRTIPRAPIVSTKSSTPIANPLNSVTTVLEDESD